jgi:HEAT repeats
MSGPIEDSDVAQLPEDLPPVKPPSAGFLVQLFVVPGLIVLAIVGVWLLFGKLATADQDWRGLVVELQNQNPHRRGRAKMGLAQMLAADQKRDAGDQKLSTNPELARALAEVLTTELNRGGSGAEVVEHLAFLARTLGLLDLPEAVLPALSQAMRADYDREIRKNAIGSIAVMTDRMSTNKTGAPFEPFVAELLTVSADDDPLLRQLGAYTLGFFPQPAARERLFVLLEDANPGTRLNAAIALARNGDSGGIAVFSDVLKQAFSSAGGDPGSSDEYSQFVSLRNSLGAVERLAGKITAEQRADLIELMLPIAQKYREPKIRIAAQSAVVALKSVP